MKNPEDIVSFVVIGIIIGYIVCIVCIGASIIPDNSYKNIYERNQKLIIECEKTLPRTETCILVAVPKPTK